MKLLKLSTDGINGQYNNYFREPLHIPANAKIGLKTASISLSSKVVEVTADNNLIRYRLKNNGTLFEVGLSNGKYTYQDFLNELFKRFNSALPHRQGVYDMWQFTYDSSRRLEISYSKGGLAFPTLITTAANVTIDEATKSIDNTVASAQQWTKYVYSDDLFAKGNGYMSWINPEDTTEYCIGLTAVSNIASATVQPSDYVFGYHYVNDDIYIILNGIEYQVTAYTHSVDETDYIAFHDGYCDFYSIDPADTVRNYLQDIINANPNIQEEDYYIDFETDYHFVCSFKTTGKITELKYSRDPFIVDTATGQTRNRRAVPNDIIDSAADLNKYKTSTQASAVEIIFVNNSNRLLGFGQHNNLRRIAKQFRLTAPSTLDILDNSRLLLVNLPNLTSLNSYDGTTSKREEIIEVVPLNLSESYYVNYDPNNIHFVDINNASPISIQNFTVRLTNEKYETLELEDGADIVLLLD
jgi:hypothetical protein